MPRPRICRFVEESPRVDYFKPRGVPLVSLEEMVLPLEGLEALRLAEVEGLDQEEAALRMGVSRPTFSRVLAQARRVVALALVHGRALRITGGDYRLPGEEPQGPCLGGLGGGGRRRRGGWRGRGQGRGMAVPGDHDPNQGG